MSGVPTITIPITVKISDFRELITLAGGRAAAEAILAKLLDVFLAHRAWLNAHDADALSRDEAYQRIRASIEDLLPES
jgi:hypothetical protein